MLGHADPRLHRRNGPSTITTADYSQNLKVNGEGCAEGESKMLVDVSLEWQL